MFIITPPLPPQPQPQTPLLPNEDYEHLLKGAGPRIDYCTTSLPCPVVIDDTGT